MKESLKKKIETVNYTGEKISNSTLMAIIEYKGITSIEMKYLRKELNKNNIKIEIIKNSLTKKALEKTNNNQIIENINGQIFILYSEKEINVPLKIMDTYNKKIKEKLKFKAIYLCGKLIKFKKLEEILNMPTKEESLLNIINIIKKPLLNLKYLIEQPYVKLLKTLNDIK